MNIDRLKTALSQVKGQDGRVDTQKLDKLMLEVRDGPGLDATERGELIKAADGFDDAGKQRLLSHLSMLGQTNAFVNVSALGSVTQVKGRYAEMAVNVPGLSAKVGLFDNTFALKGRAQADGVLRLQVEGQSVEVPVKRGELPAQILEHVRARLPSQVTGMVLGGDVKPYDAETYRGAAPSPRSQAAHLALYKPEALGLKPGEKPLRVVVTGYGAFMGITDNPSANMAQRLSEQGVKGAIIEYRRLDVTQDAVNTFMTEMKRTPPDVILSMGVSSESQVEERPENNVGSGHDGANQPLRSGAIKVDGERELKTDLPVETIDWALQRFGDKREVGTSKSDPAYTPDRSAYLCNFLGYNLADAFGKTEATTAGFVHVTDHTPTEQMHALLEAVVARQLDARRNLPPS